MKKIRKLLNSHAMLMVHHQKDKNHPSEAVHQLLVLTIGNRIKNPTVTIVPQRWPTEELFTLTNVQ
jgi:hypothetical protein